MKTAGILTIIKTLKEVRPISRDDIIKLEDEGLDIVSVCTHAASILEGYMALPREIQHMVLLSGLTDNEDLRQQFIDMIPIQAQLAYFRILNEKMQAGDMFCTVTGNIRSDCTCSDCDTDVD